MTRIQALLAAALSLAAFGVGFTELLHSVSHQTTVISALVAMGGLMGVITLVTQHGAEVEQAKYDCDFIGAASIMLDILSRTPDAAIRQETIERLKVIANRAVWCPLQKRNADEANDLLAEAGEGEASLDALLRASAA